MKIDKNFKMSGQSKRILATITDPESRSLYKKMTINAQVSSERAPPDRSVRLKEKEAE